MQKSAANVYNLVENLLEWAEAHKRREPSQPGTVILQPLISEVIALLDGAARQKRIVVRNLVPTEFKVKSEPLDLAGTRAKSCIQFDQVHDRRWLG